MNSYNHRRYAVTGTGLTVQELNRVDDRCGVTGTGLTVQELNRVDDRCGVTGNEVGTSDCVTRPMNDEDHAHMMALLNKKRCHRGVISDNPDEAKDDRNPAQIDERI